MIQKKSGLDRPLLIDIYHQGAIENQLGLLGIVNKTLKKPSAYQLFIYIFFPFVFVDKVYRSSKIIQLFIYTLRAIFFLIFI